MEGERRAERDQILARMRKAHESRLAASLA
jgi:hypothetical protein